MRNLAAAMVMALATATPSLGSWATRLEGFDLGTNGNTNYTDATSVLGSVTTVTGKGSTFEGPVTIFNPPYDAEDIISIGAGGYVTVSFDDPVKDRPGADVIIYGNAGFFDADWPNSVIGDPASLFGADGEGSTVSISANGVDYFPIPGLVDMWYPTQPWLDTAASVPADFTQPVPDGLAPTDFDGATYVDALALYNGSAGGTPLDIAGSGLTEFTFLRVDYDGTGGDGNLELDAIAVVPEPSVLWLILGGLATLGWRATRTS